MRITNAIGVGVGELLKKHQEWKSVSVNCFMPEWEMYKQKCQDRKLYQKKIIWCMDGICLEQTIILAKRKKDKKDKIVIKTQKRQNYFWV